MGTDSDVEWEKTEQAHERYRGVGLALMTTVTGLSTGAMYALGKEEPLRGVARLFFIPIVACLVQQLAHYLGSQHQARSLYHWSRWLGMMQRESAVDDKIKELENRFMEMGNANRWYSAADCSCIAAVALFIIAGTYVCMFKL